MHMNERKRELYIYMEKIEIMKDEEETTLRHVNLVIHWEYIYL